MGRRIGQHSQHVAHGWRARRQAITSDEPMSMQHHACRLVAAPMFPVGTAVARSIFDAHQDGLRQMWRGCMQRDSHQTENTNMDDGLDDGAGSVGSRVLWLILHAFILIMSLFMVTVYNVFRACWTLRCITSGGTAGAYPATVPAAAREGASLPSSSGARRVHFRMGLT